jgi:hypothetical protein
LLFAGGELSKVLGVLIRTKQRKLEKPPLGKRGWGEFKSQ